MYDYYYYVLLGFAILLLMLIFQLWLDPKRSISKRALIRNILISFGFLSYYKFNFSLYYLLIIMTCLEIIQEILILKFNISLDPIENKILNFYRWADILWKSKEMKNFNSYAEGKYDSDTTRSFQNSLVEKFKWLTIAAGLETTNEKSKFRVLEIGCGNGELLKYLSSKGVNATGVTLSPDQKELLKNSGLDVILGNVWDVLPNLKGQFDSIILNGPIEHLLPGSSTHEDQLRKYKYLFELLNGAIDPNSKYRKIVIACIHFHRPLSIYEYFQTWLLEASYGGSYPFQTDTLTQSASSWFKTLLVEDHTLDYYIYSNQIWWHCFNGIFKDLKIFTYSLIDIPVFLLNDPYYIHKVLHLIFQTWAWQFSFPFSPLFSYNDTPPVKHLWIVLQQYSSSRF